MARVDLSKSNLRQRRLRQRRILLVLLGVFVLLVVGVLALLTWLPFVRVSEVEVVGQKTVLVGDVTRLVESELEGSYFLLFAKSNIALYPKHALEQKLTLSFPTFLETKIRTKNFHTISVSVVERQPVALWCGESQSATSSCFLLDATGVVYAPAVVYSGDAYQKYYGPVDGHELPQQFLNQATFHALGGLVEALQKTQHMRIQTIAVDAEGDAQLVFEGNFTLILSLADEGGDVLERFGLALNANPFTGRKLTDFEYLDLRFGDRLYYKLRAAAIASSTPKSKSPIQ